MTSTTTGLPDRYRPLDQVGPDEPTPTGVIRCFRARDRVLNRDVAVRVHTPAGAAAHEWITRALTAGGLATPALAMVYDASEGAGDPQAPGGAAYVVNEWIDGETLADRLGRGPMPDREVRTVLRRLAEGVAEAHRVGLAVGGLNPDNVVLRPNGLVGLRAVPAATGTIDGDITALGSLLESCLTGSAPGAERSLSGPSDLVALARRARSTEPGQGLSSVAAMAALLAERPRGHSTGPTAHVRGDESDSSWLRRLRDRRAESPANTGEAPSDTAEEPAVKLDPQTLPPVPGSVPAIPAAGATGATAATAAPSSTTTPAAPPAVTPDSSTAPDGSAPPNRAVASGDTTGRGGDDYEDEEPFGVLHADEPSAREDPADEDDGRKHRGLVVGLPLLALVVVVALAWWFGSTVLSVTDSVDDLEGSTPSASVPTAPEEGADEAEDAGEGTTAAGPVAVAGAEVFDPFGDGAPENDPEVPLSYDGDPATGWSTLTYQGSPALGNLKPGVGVRYDLGEAQALAGVTVATSTPGATVEIRAGDEPAGAVESYPVVAQGTLEGTTEFTLDEPVTGRYVLVWITELVPSGDGFAAELSEVTVTAAG